ISTRWRPHNGSCSRYAFSSFTGRSDDCLKQRLVGLRARLESGGVLEVADRRVGPWSIEPVERTVIIASARELALNIGYNFSRAARCGRGNFGRSRTSPRLDSADRYRRHGLALWAGRLAGGFGRFEERRRM